MAPETEKSLQTCRAAALAARAEQSGLDEAEAVYRADVGYVSGAAR